jgi:septum site-determining protein MinC
MGDSIITRERQSCFQIKTSFLPCTLLQILQYDLDQLSQQLAETIQKAPTFFIGSPIVIDLEGVKHLGVLDFARIKQIILANNMVPVGVRGGNEVQQMAAATQGLTTLTMNKASTTNNVNTSTTTSDSNNANQAVSDKKPISALPSKVITTPIRSGMQIYAKDADLIVLASVSAGAELIADGHIHVYGTLRGRALAGVQGNDDARIFCRTLEAELVAIAGYYLTKEDIQNAPTQAAMVQIYLDHEQVKIDAL